MGHDASWAEQEFAGAKVGDARLANRLIKLADRLGNAPSASIPGACNGKAEPQAAYRLFDQARSDKRGLGWDDVLEPHMVSTEACMAEHPVVLSVQDTTELDFNGQEIDGLGSLSFEAQRGMYLHSTYVVTPQRLPLGIVDAWMWARPLDTLESRRWVEGYERQAELAGKLPGRTNRPARQVRQTLYAKVVELPDGCGGTIPVTCLIARETGAPQGQKAVEWRLLTNRKVVTLKDAAQLIDWYRCCWEIEILFHVLKNGCRVEALQLGEIKKLEMAVVIYLVVAWRLAHLMRLGRVYPNLPASAVFDQTEWQAAWLLAEKTPPKQTPTVREVIRRIAMLGGFLARKGNGEPGVKTLWQGFTRLTSFVKGIEHMRTVHAL